MSKENRKKKITGEAFENLIWCFICRSSKETCSKKYNYNTKIPNLPWAVSIKCPNPQHASWIVCSKCTSSNKRMFNERQTQRHNTRYHSEKRGIDCHKKQITNSSTIMIQRAKTPKII